MLEYTDYHIYLEGTQNNIVELRHQDAALLKHLTRPRAGSSVLHGILSFGGQIGRSSFSILVNGEPEYDVEVEVFPSKLDYFSDYLGLIAELQSIGTALVLEFLRSTIHHGRPAEASSNTPVEWATLLRAGIDELEAALHKIAIHPHRAIERTVKQVRPDRIKRIGSQTRKALRQNHDGPATSELITGVHLPNRLPERATELTLDSPEHRWIAAKLQEIRRELASLVKLQRRWEKRDRRASATRVQLQGLEQRIATLERLPFCAAARGQTPSRSVNSLALFTAPGYREAFRVLTGLSRALHVAAGPVTLSTKDLHVLYEYWAFVTVVRIVAEEMEQPFPTGMLSTSVDGLRATLHVRNKREISFTHSPGRIIRVAYKPKLHGDAYLVAQEPDILVSIEDEGWPLMTFVLDAKYRLDESKQYALKYGYPGPPEDALNVLYRYRDAILHQVTGSSSPRPRLMHTVVEAAALYPPPTEQNGNYNESKLYRAFETIGVGAIPLLPGSTDVLRGWFRRALHRGGWTTADKVVPHTMRERAVVLHRLAFERILVGVLRGENRREHLDWIIHCEQYYVPASADARLQFSARGVAIYSPSPLSTPGAITHFAEVADIEMKRRGEIQTPWQSLRSDDLMIVYHLRDFREITPIHNVAPAVRFSSHRWTSRLAMARAAKVVELCLETEAEWRMYEELTVRHLPVTVRAGRASAVNSFGRAQFILREGTLTYTGDNQFALRTAAGIEHFVSIEEVITFLGKAPQE